MPENSDDGYVVVRNVHNSVVVFSGLGRSLLVQWGSPRQQDGSDVQRVPDEVVKHPGFRKAVAKGILQITTEADLQRALEIQLAREAGDMSSLDNQVKAAMESPPEQIIIQEDSITQATGSTDADGRTVHPTTDIEGVLSSAGGISKGANPS